MNHKPTPRLTTRQTTTRIGRTEIALEAISFEARHPAGGVVWNRPAAVRVRGANGEQRLPIRDVTRRAQLALFGVGVLFLLAGLMIRPRMSTD